MREWQKYLSVFLVMWGVLTTTINSWNGRYFLLQNAVIEGLVTKRSFALSDQIIPGFNLSEGNDIFRFNESFFPMKQPGQAVLGAVIYLPLRMLGIEWQHHYDYTSNLITMFSSGFLVALTGTLLYAISKSLVAPILLLATLMWPYAGVSHHDVYASAVMFLAIYLAYRQKYLLAGIVAGLGLFFSMLPLTMPGGILLAMLMVTRDKRIAIRYVMGFLVGILPSLIFNYLNFGNPLLFPNLAGKVKDTVPHFDIKNMADHFYFYLLSPETSIWAFSPVLVFALVGYKELKQRSPLMGVMLWLLPLLLVGHISMQETYGGYQYGPRYLLPLMPILALASALAWQRIGKKLAILFVLTLVYSLGVSIVGALTTVMYPMPNPVYAPLAQTLLLIDGQRPEYRLLPIGVLFVLLGILVRSPRLKRTLEHLNPIRRPNG